MSKTVEIKISDFSGGIADDVRKFSNSELI